MTLSNPIVTVERLASRNGSTRVKPRMLLIVNPKATTVSGRLKNLVVYALRGRFDVEAVETKAQGHAIELTREAATEGGDGFDLVVAFGGDGTVNEVANGLANSNLPMAPLPGGCTNVVCRMLGVPNDVVDATERLLRLAEGFTPRRVDLGRVNGRHFVFSSGVGLDADVTRWVDERPKAKSRGGVATFTFAAINTYLRDYRGRPAQLAVETADGSRYEGLSALVQNSDPYTYFGARPIRVCEDAAIDNGSLSMMVMQRAASRDVPGAVRRLFSAGGTLATHPQAASLTELRHARVVPAAGNEERTLPVEADGEYIGRHPEIVYESSPGALLVAG